MYFKNELKYSKRSDHVTDDVMSLFWSREKLSGRTLLSCKFSLPCDETSTLYSPRPSFPTFSLMFIASLNFKCSTQPKPQIYMPFYFSTMKLNHLLMSHLGWWRHQSRDHCWIRVFCCCDWDVITLDVTWENNLWQMLSCCGLTFFYV